MASLNQLVSEIAHSLGQPNNYSLRENIRSIIIHERNEKIRRSYQNHGYIDAGLEQRFRISLITVPTGGLTSADLKGQHWQIDAPVCKRSKDKVPRPVRLTNNLPFNRVSTVGHEYCMEIPFMKEGRAQFRFNTPGLCGLPCYDYINDYLYLFPIGDSKVDMIDSIIIQAAFEHPKEVQEVIDKDAIKDDAERWSFINDDDEWFLPEDMIGPIKDTIYRRDLLTTVRETNEIPKENLVK